MRDEYIIPPTSGQSLDGFLVIVYRALPEGGFVNAAESKQALADQDRERRIKTYQEIEHILMDDAVHVPLFNGISMYLCNPRVQGFYSRSEYGIYFEQMWIKR